MVEVRFRMTKVYVIVVFKIILYEIDYILTFKLKYVKVVFNLTGRFKKKKEIGQ